MTKLFKQAVNGGQGCGYAVATIATSSVAVATTTVYMAVKSANVVMPIGGLEKRLAPLSSYVFSGTVFFASKTNHKMHRAAGNETHKDNSKHAFDEHRVIFR